jgi:hypothetical protein
MTMVHRQCDKKNFGQSFFCSFDNLTQMPDPPIWGQQVLDHYQQSMDIPHSLKNFRNNNRTPKFSNFYNQIIFTKIERNYDAFDKDIAILNVFFKSPTALEFR